MERTGVMAVAVADRAAALEAGLWRSAPVLRQGSLLEAERALQQVARAVMGVVASVVLADRARGPEGEAASCRQCDRRLHLVGREREHTVVGLTADYRFARPTFYCAHCHVCLRDGAQAIANLPALYHSAPAAGPPSEPAVPWFASACCSSRPLHHRAPP